MFSRNAVLRNVSPFALFYQELKKSGKLNGMKQPQMYASGLYKKLSPEARDAITTRAEKISFTQSKEYEDIMKKHRRSITHLPLRRRYLIALDLLTEAKKEVAHNTKTSNTLKNNSTKASPSASPHAVPTKKMAVVLKKGKMVPPTKPLFYRSKAKLLSKKAAPTKVFFKPAKKNSVFTPAAMKTSASKSVAVSGSTTTTPKPLSHSAHRPTTSVQKMTSVSVPQRVVVAALPKKNPVPMSLQPTRGSVTVTPKTPTAVFQPKSSIKVNRKSRERNAKNGAKSVALKSAKKSGVFTPATVKKKSIKSVATATRSSTKPVLKSPGKPTPVIPDHKRPMKTVLKKQVQKKRAVAATPMASIKSARHTK